MINNLIGPTENSTETCIIIDAPYRGAKPVPGGEWTGLVHFSTTLTFTIISTKDKGTIRALGTLIEKLLVNGIPETSYDGATYYLQTFGEEMGRKFLDDPESEQSREVLTLRGHGYYQK